MESHTVLFAECLFSPVCNNDVSKAHCKSLKSQELPMTIERTFATLRSKDNDQKIVFLYISCEMKEVHHKSGMIDEFSKLAEKFQAEAKSIGSADTFEKAIIIAKSTIDSYSGRNINFIIPSEKYEYTKKVTNLIFNDLSYSLSFDVVSVPGISQNGTSQMDGTVEEEVRKILSCLPSCDGLPVSLLQSPLIPENYFYHGFSTRAGGVSTFPTMRSLSLVFSSRKKDTKFFVEENRRRLAQFAGFSNEKFHIAKAVHGVDVWVIGDEPPSTYDAIVTDKPGITVAAPGADCQTLLFCDPVKRVVGAAHSGWKGTIDRIQQNVVHVMKQRFGCEPKDIRVVIGPSIGVCCYNVTKERAREFIDGVVEDSVDFRDGVAFLDLWRATVVLLEEVGILRENIDQGNRFTDAELGGKQKVTQCTQCNKDKFFSYRRDGAIFGNQVGFIGINEE